MFPNFCTSLGFAGWLVMVLVVAAVISLAVWGVACLFPSPPPDPAPLATATPPDKAARAVREPAPAKQLVDAAQR